MHVKSFTLQPPEQCGRIPDLLPAPRQTHAHVPHPSTESKFGNLNVEFKILTNEFAILLRSIWIVGNEWPCGRNACFSFDPLNQSNRQNYSRCHRMTEQPEVS